MKPGRGSFGYPPQVVSSWHAPPISIVGLLLRLRCSTQYHSFRVTLGCVTRVGCGNQTLLTKRGIFRTREMVSRQNIERMGILLEYSTNEHVLCSRKPTLVLNSAHVSL